MSEDEDVDILEDYNSENFTLKFNSNRPEDRLLGDDNEHLHQNYNFNHSKHTYVHNPSNIKDVMIAFTTAKSTYNVPHKDTQIIKKINKIIRKPKIKLNKTTGDLKNNFQNINLIKATTSKNIAKLINIKEEIIKIKKDESDTELEINVDDSNEITNYIIDKTSEKKLINNSDDNLIVPKENVNNKKLKRKLVKIGLKNSDGKGGFTLAHNEEGDVIDTYIGKEEKPKPIKKPTVRLIYCQPFTTINKQPCTVNLHLSALLMMDFHAHASLMEVMGLLGGKWDPNEKTLTVSHYEPCKNLASSSTHCDMCPISQAKAVDIFHNDNLNVLGWFHSHPTFAPEPSQQDLNTQQDVQNWIDWTTPCLGIILSPYNYNGTTIASPYRCMIVQKKENLIPFKFEVNLFSDNFNIDEFINGIKKIADNFSDNQCTKVGWNEPYLLDPSITYFEKFVSSLRMHLIKCEDLDKTKKDLIIENIIKIGNYL